jgi:translation elongation factor EF-1alpha
VVGVLDKDGKSKKVPFVRGSQTCDVIIEVPGGPVFVETYKDYPTLGRIVLREDGATVGIGIITSTCVDDAGRQEEE